MSLSSAGVLSCEVVRLSLRIQEKHAPLKAMPEMDAMIKINRIQCQYMVSLHYSPCDAVESPAAINAPYYCSTRGSRRRRRPRPLYHVYPCIMYAPIFRISATRAPQGVLGDRRVGASFAREPRLHLYHRRACMVMALCEDSGAAGVHAGQRVCDGVVRPDPDLRIRSDQQPIWARVPDSRPAAPVHIFTFF